MPVQQVDLKFLFCFPLLRTKARSAAAATTTKARTRTAAGAAAATAATTATTERRRKKRKQRRKCKNKCNNSRNNSNNHNQKSNEQRNFKCTRCPCLCRFHGNVNKDIFATSGSRLCQKVQARSCQNHTNAGTLYKHNNQHQTTKLKREHV